MKEEKPNEMYKRGLPPVLMSSIISLDSVLDEVKWQKVLRAGSRSGIPRKIYAELLWRHLQGNVLLN